MRLSTYLREKKLSVAEFGLLVHANPSVVRTWISGLRIPSPQNMKAIFKITKGLVDANEFYGLRKPTRGRKEKEAAE